MARIFNPLLKSGLDAISLLEVVSSDPATGADGQMIINNTDDTVKLWYAGSWQTLHTLTPAAASYLLQEIGDFLLQESGDKFIQE